MPVRQVPLEQLDPRVDHPVAVLALEPAEISARCGLTFEESADDLNRLQAAVFTVGEKQFVLVRHAHQPSPGTELRARRDSGRLVDDVTEALSALGVHPEGVSWWHPEVSPETTGVASAGHAARMGPVEPT